MERLVNDAIADMNGHEALPRRSGELVFHDDWERRVFAMTVALYERGEFEWTEFRDRLIRSIGDPGTVSADYFECWLASFESLLAEKRVLIGDHRDR